MSTNALLPLMCVRDGAKGEWRWKLWQFRLLDAYVICIIVNIQYICGWRDVWRRLPKAFSIEGGFHVERFEYVDRVSKSANRYIAEHLDESFDDNIRLMWLNNIFSLQWAPISMRRQYFGHDDNGIVCCLYATWMCTVCVIQRYLIKAGSTRLSTITRKYIAMWSLWRRSILQIARFTIRRC